MQRPVSLITTPALGAILALAACGPPFTIAQGSGGTGGDTGTGGTASSSGSASSGTGGTTPGCTPGLLGSCGAGMYCESGTNACRSCEDFSRLHFSMPAPVMITPDTTGTTAFYPRVSSADETLYFARKYKNGTLPVRQIASALINNKHDGWTMWSELDAPINTAFDESGPLWLKDGAILENLVDTGKVDLGKPVLLFDSNRDGLTTFKLFAANLDGTEASEVALPTGKRDTDVAAAPNANPPRFYWLTDAGNMGSTIGQHLVTATAMSQATEVKVTFDNGCATSNVQAPWVTLDGKHLFFAAQYPDGAGCTPGLNAPLRLFHAHMDDTGAEVANDAAAPLFPDDTVSYDSTPALEPGKCVLVFARSDAMNMGRLAYALRD